MELTAFFDDEPEVTERTHSSLYRCECHPPANGHHFGEDLLCVRCALPWPQASACVPKQRADACPACGVPMKPYGPNATTLRCRPCILRARNAA